MAYVEPIAAFFGPEDPGVVAAVINGVTVYGQLEQDMEETLESPTRRGIPMLLCAKDALPTISQGDTVTVGALTYKVRDVERSDYDPIAILHLNNT
ncbi:MAG: hypothetical protein IPO75_15855 [Betaproteobacteria bacterium]|nr:hypothetical protein [Betaproteobacteria bacterium]